MIIASSIWSTPTNLFFYRRGYNALCHALKSNTRLDVIKVLLEYNADVNHITKDNLTPIKLATLHKDPNVLMLLLQTVKFVNK